MKILFLHPNFPGQFKNIAAFVASLGHDVKFLCQTHYDRTILGVDRICLKGNLGDDYLSNNSSSILESMRIRSKQYKAAFAKLSSQKWSPDVVISHSGWGCGVYSRYVWPVAKRIVYSEWWYKLDADIYSSANRSDWLDVSPTLRSKLWERNQMVALELLDADEIVTPSIWQQKQLPSTLQDISHVISDGFDLGLLKKGNLCSSPVLTYGTRGMEAVRGFPQFIQALPHLIDKHPDLLVSIAGLDNIHYIGKPPHEFKSWKKWALSFLKEHQIHGNVSWVGYLPKDDYVKWLQASWCHVYLSEPYIPSWSLIEASLCCQRLVVTDNDFTHEFTSVESTIYCDHNNIENLFQSVSDTLGISSASSETTQAYGDEPSSYIALKNTVDLNASMKCWQSLILG
jgi:glycosyltransferase involved in cell wall biosynthesis